MEKLNPQQREAVTTTEGYVLVLAGAGSGKTRVLTERIAYLIREKKVSPERILAFTFTNKAAGEMRSRVERLLERRDLPLWIGTFHATGLRILRREAKYLGYSNKFAVFDEDDSISLLKNIIKKKGFKLDEYSPKDVRWLISRWKNDLVIPEEAKQNASFAEERRIAGLYEAYTSEMRKCNAFDFDDLITKVVELFTAFPKVKERYARQFKYVLVDEFQDTNKMQMLLIDALSSHNRNLFVVGDDDQAIYGWRGATVNNILQFDRLYKGTVVIRLEQNYRSTNRILDGANSVISHNVGRKGKKLWSKKGTGEPIRLFHAYDEEEEADKVREVITQLIRDGFRRKDIAVLYRTHAQSRALESALRTSGLPYQIIGGVRFYERREIKDLLAYLKLVSNPMDDVSFRRIINVPKRGIGSVTLQKIEGNERGRGLFNTIKDEKFRESLSKRQAEMINGFLKALLPLEVKAKKMDVFNLMNELIESIHYRDYLLLDASSARDRLENIEELLAEARRFAGTSRDPTLSAFLEEIALLSDIDTMKNEETVALMTLHNSKGLEFRAVLITGLEEGLLPHYSSFEDEEELEEERRLFYVGMTRARERLFLFSAANRLKYTGWVSSEPSRFISEISRDVLEVEQEEEEEENFMERFHEIEAVHEERTVRSKERFVVGASIFHPTFGKGILKEVDGSGKDMRVTVYFPGVGEKKFLASYAP
ncbi:hypothetical protein DRQ05_03245, partial [bacterium]